MPYSTPIKSMHIACILCCRFCRYCKATNNVHLHRFWVLYKHNGAYFTHSMTFWTFLWSLCLHALHTLSLVWPLYIYVHFGFLLSAAQRCRVANVFSPKKAGPCPKKAGKSQTAVLRRMHIIHTSDVVETATSETETW